MKIKQLFVVFAMIAGLTAQLFAQSNEYRVSAPVSYKNLSVFLIHGKDKTDHKNILTLQEAMEKKAFSLCMRHPM